MTAILRAFLFGCLRGALTLLGLIGFGAWLWGAT